MNCDVLLERVAMVGFGPDQPDAAVEAHLSVCPECRVRLTAAQTLGGRLRDPLLWEEPPNGLVETILEEVTGAPVPSRSLRPWWALVAAVVLAGVVFGVSQLVNRPHWSIDLISGPAAPGATAVASGWVSGGQTRIVLEMSGLVEAPPGAYYEIWLTADDGRHVSAGTFRHPGRVEVVAGVLKSEYPRIWVTLEPADDDPTPFPATVLDTALGYDRQTGQKPVANT